MKVQAIRWFLGFLLMALIISGCGSSNIPGVYLSNNPPKIKKIAVLPFDNISGRGDAGKIVCNVFITELFRSNRYQVEEPGNIAQFMVHERIRVIGEMEQEKIKLLGRRFAVDAVIVGVVEEFDDGLNGGFTPVPLLSLSVRMIETKEGKIVWSAQNKRKGTDYVLVFDAGEVRSVVSLTKKVVAEMIETME